MTTQSVGTVLLILLTTKSGIRAETMAIEEAAARRNKLVVLFVVDENIASPANKQLLATMVGPKGAKPLGEEIVRDYERRARMRFDEIESVCREQGVAFESKMAPGAFLDVVRSEISLLRPDLVILPNRKKSFLTKLFMKDDVDIVRTVIPDTEIQIVDEGI